MKPLVFDSSRSSYRCERESRCLQCKSSSSSGIVLSDSIRFPSERSFASNNTVKLSAYAVTAIWRSVGPMACTAKLDVGASQEPASPAESNVLILAWTDSVLMLNMELNVSMEILS